MKPEMSESGFAGCVDVQDVARINPESAVRCGVTDLDWQADMRHDLFGE